MRPLSIRVKLTLLYLAIMVATVAALGAGIIWAIRESVHAAADEDLRLKLAGVERLLERYDPAISIERVREELREHSGLRPGGDLLQVADASGKWIFRSASIREYNMSLLLGEADAPRLETVHVNGQPLRLLSARATVSGTNYRVQLATPLSESYAVLRRFQWFLLLSIPPLLVLSSLGGYWMSRRALAPVDAITSTARSISEHNLSRRLDIAKTGDELQRLSETFNQMMDRLEAAFKRITQFTADASHELRTPVALIRTAAELSLRRQRNETEYREALAQILEESERMSVLIESLMTLARMDSGSETLNLDPVDLASILRGVCTQSETLTQSKQIQFGYDLPTEAVLVDADELTIRRLFLILIDNAIKYTTAGGRVQVKLETDGQQAFVEVRDTGIGIPNEDIPHIFERFYRADKARSREMGAGLGLSIARWIADMHGALIQVETTIGAGSCFKVSMRCTVSPR